MSFQIVKAETRLARMITWLSGLQAIITDFIVGGKTRTKLEAVAVELEAQDYQFFQAIKKAIPTSIYYAFDFSLRPAVRAAGNVTFSASPAPAYDIAIPIGTQVSTVATSTTPAKIYTTSQAAVLEAGQTSVSVPVSCTVAGTEGNTGVGTITVLKTTISGLSSVANPSALSNGAAAESEAQREIRFREYVTTLTRGTAAACEYGSKSAYLADAGGNITEEVKAALVTGPPETGSAGSFTIYIYNGVDGASTELIARAQEIIDGYTDATGQKIPGYKAAGIVATVAAATTVAQNVTVTITSADGATVSQSAAETIIDNYIRSLQLGETLVFNELVERLMGMAGVVDVAISAPTGNVTCLSNQIIIPGTISVTIS